jgi:hypothetical protein
MQMGPCSLHFPVLPLLPRRAIRPTAATPLGVGGGLPGAGANSGRRGGGVMASRSTSVSSSLRRARVKVNAPPPSSVTLRRRAGAASSMTAPARRPHHPAQIRWQVRLSLDLEGVEKIRGTTGPRSGGAATPSRPSSSRSTSPATALLPQWSRRPSRPLLFFLGGHGILPAAADRLPCSVSLPRSIPPPAGANEPARMRSCCGTLLEPSPFAARDPAAYGVFAHAGVLRLLETV